MEEFDHQRYEAGRVALAALVGGEGLVKELPRGYAGLSDQLRRALTSTYLNTAEALQREGADRVSRLRIAKAEANEAAAAIDALKALGLAEAGKADALLAMLDRACRLIWGLQRAR